MRDIISRAALLDEIAVRRRLGSIGKTEAARWTKIINEFPEADEATVCAALVPNEGAVDKNAVH